MTLRLTGRQSSSSWKTSPDEMMSSTMMRTTIFPWRVACGRVFMCSSKTWHWSVCPATPSNKSLWRSFFCLPDVDEATADYLQSITFDVLDDPSLKVTGCRAKYPAALRRFYVSDRRRHTFNISIGPLCRYYICLFFVFCQCEPFVIKSSQFINMQVKESDSAQFWTPFTITMICSVLKPIELYQYFV